MNKINLNGQDISILGLTSFPVSGFTASSGNKLQSWTISTKSIDAVTHIGLIDSNNVQGPIRYIFYDTFDSVTEVIGNNVGDIVPVMLENIERIIVASDRVTTDGQPPRNLKLVLNGCIRSIGLSTKAQIESTTTTVATGMPVQ